MEIQTEDVERTLLDHEQRIDFNLSEPMLPSAAALTPLAPLDMDVAITVTQVTQVAQVAQVAQDPCTSPHPALSVSQQGYPGIQGEANHWLPHNPPMPGSMHGNFVGSSLGSFDASLPNHQINGVLGNVSGQGEPDSTLDDFITVNSVNPFGPSLDASRVLSVAEHAWPRGTQYGIEQHTPTTAFQSGVHPSTHIGSLNQVHPNDFWNGFSAIENYNIHLPQSSSIPFQHSDISSQSTQQNIAINRGTHSDTVSTDIGLNTHIAASSLPQRAQNSIIICPFCSESFTRNSDLIRHTTTIHTDRKLCAFCDKLMAVRRDKYKEHLVNGHKMKRNVAKKYSDEW